MLQYEINWFTIGYWWNILFIGKGRREGGFCVFAQISYLMKNVLNIGKKKEVLP